MFKKIFKSVKDKLSNVGKKPKEIPGAATVSTQDMPKAKEKKPIHISRKEKRSRRARGIRNGSKGTIFFNGKPDKHLRKKVA